MSLLPLRRTRASLTRMKVAIALALTIVQHGMPLVDAMIHNLSIRNDARRAFQIETFGFREGGQMNLTVSGFSVQGPEPYRTGFVVRRTKTGSSAQEHLEDILGDFDGDNRCLLDEPRPEDLVLELTANAKGGDGERDATRHAVRTVGPGQEGLYVLLYCGCTGKDDSAKVESQREGRDAAVPEVETVVPEAVSRNTGFFSRTSGGGARQARHHSSFKLRVEFWNERDEGTRDYLSAGSEVLPKLFFGMFFFFLAALVAWIQCIRKHPAQVHHIHHMMTVLLVFKTLSMLFESIRYHYLRLTGAAEAWSIVYYLFAFLKGITLFVVILLIGMGWSLIKPFLNARDKRIIFVVLCLQVLNNVAQIVLEETAPGSIVWLKWENLLHAVDIACCFMILFPIVWSVRHLKQASLVEDKAESTIRRLNVFTQFYQMVFVYVYFTRIVVILHGTMLPFELSWVQTLSSEIATLVFFVFTGWRFRPQPDAAYLPVAKDEHEDEGEATEDIESTGLQLQDFRRQQPARHNV